MTRKAATQPVDDDNPDSGALVASPGNMPGEFLDEPDGMDDSIINAITLLSGGTDPHAAVKIYRTVKGSATAEFCMQMTPAEFAADHENVIQQAFGGGRYIVRIYGSNPVNNGRVSMMARGEINIAEPRNAVVASSDPVSNALLSRLEKIEQHVVPATAAAQPVDVMARVQQGVGIFTGIVAALAPIVLPLINRPAPQTGSVKETLENMAALKAVVGDMTGGAEKSDAALMMETVQALGPAFLEAMQAQRGMQPVAPMPQTMSTPQPLTLNNPATAPVKAPDMDMFVLQLSMLASVAAKSGNPETWANNILDSCDEAQEHELLALLQFPDWFEQLCAKNPLVTPHKVWFAGVRDEILKQYVSDEPPAETKPAAKTAAKNDDKKTPAVKPDKAAVPGA